MVLSVATLGVSLDEVVLLQCLCRIVAAGVECDVCYQLIVIVLMLVIGF